MPESLFRGPPVPERPLFGVGLGESSRERHEWLDDALAHGVSICSGADHLNAALQFSWEPKFPGHGWNPSSQSDGALNLGTWDFFGLWPLELRPSGTRRILVFEL